MPFKTAILLLSASLTGTTLSFAEGPDFAKQVQPILERNCVRCHNADKTKGGLRMDTHEALLKGGNDAEAVVPGDPAKSEMLVRVRLRPIDEGVMPDEGPALTRDEIEVLEAWVRAGAPWPAGVTLTERKPPPIKRVALPAKAPTSPIQAAAMVDDILKRENVGMEVTKVITDAAFLRRATIDLIGRIPTMPEVREYEAWGDDRRAKLIERLVAHPRFTDRWTVFMSDMLRIRSSIPGGNQLLAFVHGSIEQGKPYDVLVRELISASGRSTSNPAVGYLLGDDAKPMELAATTSQVFLGVRIGCAMCHDHPFDDWKQKDFYGFAAFFGKTKKVQGRKGEMVYTTEGNEMMVLWPPEDKAGSKARTPVSPRFPFQFAKFTKTPQHLERFEKSRERREQEKLAANTSSLDALLDAAEPTKPLDPVLEEARKESRALNVHADIARTSELRNQLAQLITDPRNDYFARAFVNRVWAELLGHGFVEPLDNFSDYNPPHNASTLDFLAQEFIASGYNLRELIRIITLSDAYRRSVPTAALAVVQREASEKSFAAAPTRRMLGEVLFDSVVVAGHLSDFKWPQGANAKEVSREIRVPIAPTTPPVTTVTKVNTVPPSAPPSTPAAMRNDGYDLESTLKLDFHTLLAKKETAEIETMRVMSDEQLEAEKMMAQQKAAQAPAMKFTTKTVTETVDDNPRFDSAMHMATPAPPAHFLRVFGQPARNGLGEFRDTSSSLRQQLMMVNGRMTHEASRVGPLEPIHAILQKDPDQAIDYAYQEILTRLPTAAEKAEARALLASDPLEGMADLRWVLLNSHEFRFLP